MKLLFGVFGHDHARYKDVLSAMVGRPDYYDERCVIVNRNLSPVSFPAQADGDGRTLFMNGTFVLKDRSMADLVADPGRIADELTRLAPERIPREFVNGAYNGVILEGDSLTLFNDFWALEPLYYFMEGEVLLFSSSLVLLNRILRRPWDNSAIREFLSFGYNFSYRTPLAGIECLPPAAMLGVKNGRMSLAHYSCYPAEAEQEALFTSIVDDIHGQFAAAVRRVYAPKKKYCLSLTGGMDSRLVYFEWPDRGTLLTETAGEGTSDFLKARALTEAIGNPRLHLMENLRSDLYIEGKQRFYEACDNPTKLLSEYNYFHLQWKKSLGADFHMTGGGGELLNGENLYLDRRPASVLREAFLPYRYAALDETARRRCIHGALYSSYKRIIGGTLAADSAGTEDELAQSIVDRLDGFLGRPGSANAYIERFRTLLLANFAYYPLSRISQDSDFLLMPLNDSDLVRSVCRHHPRTRELRKLELALLQRYGLAPDVPLDTSHLKVGSPYFAHKFMRTMRMVLNIGLHRKIPFIQKGEPPRIRAFKYFDHSAKDYREYVRGTIKGCSFFDPVRLEQYLRQVDRIDQFNFYSNHREAANLLILFRLAKAEAKFKG